MSVLNPLNPFNEQEDLSSPEKELISTEETYCEQLATLISVFADPLQKWISNLESDPKARQRPDYQIEIVKEELINRKSDIDDALFSNIRQLHDCSKELLSALKAASEHGSKNIVMDTFRRHAPFLTMYSSYTANFTSANTLMQRLLQDPRFVAFITCGELQARCKGLTLPSFLILPVQRVPRYGLLIKEAIKMTSDENGVKLLTETLKLTSTVTRRIDSKIDEDQRRNKLIELQTMLGMELLAPAREFIRDGVLTKICHSGRKDFYFVLCTDKLIYATESSGFLRSSGQKYHVNKNYDLEDLLIVVPDEDQGAKSFFVVSKDKAFEVESSSKDSCAPFVDDIVKLKNRRMLSQVKKERPWYSSERDLGFSAYALDKKNAICVKTYKVHSGADVSSGVLSFSELVMIMVDEDPSSAQRPSSMTSYQRINSNPAGFQFNETNSDTSSTTSERRSSLSLILKSAFSRGASSAGDEKSLRNATADVSRPGSVRSTLEQGESPGGAIQNQPSTEGSSGAIEIGDNQDDTELTPNFAPPPGSKFSLTRMNTADLSLFETVAPSGPGLNQIPSFEKSPEARPAAPFIQLRPPEHFTSPIVCIDEESTIAPVKADIATVSATKSETNDIRKSMPSLPPPPPPAAKKTGKGGQTRGADGVVPVTDKPSKPPATKGSAPNSGSSTRPPPKRTLTGAHRPVSLTGATPSTRSAASAIVSLSGGASNAPNAASKLSTSPTISSKGENIAADRNSKVASSKPPVIPPPLLSERDQRGSLATVMDAKAIVDAVAEVHVDPSVKLSPPIPPRRPQSTSSGGSRPESVRSGGEIATGNVKCIICDTILAYRIGTDPNAVVNQHMVQVHGLE